MKKFVSGVMALALAFSVGSTALAADNTVVAAEDTPSVTVVNHSENISVQALQEITNAASAYVQQEDGTIIPVDTVVTVEDISTNNWTRSTEQDENAYAVTLSAKASNEKIVSDSGDQNNSKYNISANMKMIWVDGPGLDNVIKKVSGELTVTNGTIVDSYVQWGNGWDSAITWTKKNLGSKTSYSYSPNLTVPCPAAAYSVTMKGAIFALTLDTYSSVSQ